MPESNAPISLRFRSLASTLAAAFGSSGFFAIQGILLARLLGPEGRGAFAAIMTYPQTFLYMGLLGSADIFARAAARLRPDDNDAAVRRAAMRYAMATGIATAALCILLAWVALPAEKAYLAPLATLAALTMPLQQIRLAVQGVDHGRGFYTRLSILRTIAAALFPAMLLVMWFGNLSSLQATTWTFVASCVAGLLLCQVGMRGDWFTRPQVSVRTTLLRNRGLAFSQIAAELLDRADLFLILFLGSLTQQGFYSSAIPIAGTMIIMPNALALFAFRRGTDPRNPLSASGVHRLLAVITAGQIVSGIVLACLIPYAVPLLYTEAFTGTVAFAWYLLPAGALRGMLMTTDGYLRGRGKPTPGIIGRLLAIVVLLTLTFVTLPFFGILSVPIALGVAQFVCLSIVVVAMYREARAS
ncbi:MAG: hypothetical protein R3C05_18250 [Pirellulaceae bacterium]